MNEKKCEWCDGYIGGMCFDCLLGTEQTLAWKYITPAEMAALAKIGFVGEIDGDNKLVRVWANEDCILLR